MVLCPRTDFLCSNFGVFLQSDWGQRAPCLGWALFGWTVSKGSDTAVQLSYSSKPEGEQRFLDGSGGRGGTPFRESPGASAAAGWSQDRLAVPESRNGGEETGQRCWTSPLQPESRRARFDDNVVYSLVYS